RGHAPGQPVRGHPLRLRRSAHSIRGEAMRRGEGSWRPAWQRFRRSRLAVAALIYVAFVTLTAVCAPLIASSRPNALVPFSPEEPEIAQRLAPPSARHRFGTDD